MEKEAEAARARAVEADTARRAAEEEAATARRRVKEQEDLRAAAERELERRREEEAVAKVTLHFTWQACAALGCGKGILCVYVCVRVCATSSTLYVRKTTLMFCM
jgi:hypothetical protein